MSDYLNPSILVVYLSSVKKILADKINKLLTEMYVTLQTNLTSNCTNKFTLIESNFYEWKKINNNPLYFLFNKLVFNWLCLGVKLNSFIKV